MKILNVHAEEEIGEIGGERDGKRVRERATGQSTSTCMGGGDGRRYRGGRRGFAHQTCKGIDGNSEKRRRE